LAANSVKFSFTSIRSFFQQNKEIKALCVHVEAEIVQIDSISINRGEYQMETSLAINYLVFEPISKLLKSVIPANVSAQKRAENTG